MTPLLIITASAAVGTAAPPQVAVALQFPVTEAVLVALKAVALNVTISADIVSTSMNKCDM
ncbi:MAG TPA: hypothetical protein VMU30_03305 [Bacteroidota bacterium]|nr:hypothetical protein [Bacteroidota bacterium]